MLSAAQRPVVTSLPTKGVRPSSFYQQTLENNLLF